MTHDPLTALTVLTTKYGRLITKIWRHQKSLFWPFMLHQNMNRLSEPTAVAYHADRFQLNTFHLWNILYHAGASIGGGGSGRSLHPVWLRGYLPRLVRS